MNTNMLKLMEERHSVRQYKDKPIEEEKRAVLNALVKQCNEEAGLHIQILYDEPKCFAGGLAHYGSFRGVSNYIAIVGPKTKDLDEKAGYYGEKIVLKAQELGLNTCWVALTHGKSAAVIGANEKQAIIISLGYGENQGVQHKDKDLSAVSNIASAPEWFKEGMKAVMYAPTAVNQQKFYFTNNNGEVTAKVKGLGTCTKIDLGIVKYHFEAVTGKKVK